MLELQGPAGTGERRLQDSLTKACRNTPASKRALAANRSIFGRWTWWMASDNCTTVDSSLLGLESRQWSLCASTLWVFADVNSDRRRSALPVCPASDVADSRRDTVWWRLLIVCSTSRRDITCQVSFSTSLPTVLALSADYDAHINAEIHQRLAFGSPHMTLNS